MWWPWSFLQGPYNFFFHGPFGRWSLHGQRYRVPWQRGKVSSSRRAPFPFLSFRKEFVLLDTDPHRAREKVMGFRLRSFWPIKILILQWFIVPLIIWTIDLDVWIVQTGISIWFQIFVPFNETALWSPEWAGISINMAGQSQFRQKDFTLLRCFMPLKDRSLIDSSCTGVTLNP